MKTIVNLNKNASALIGESSKVRIRMATIGDGIAIPERTILQIRPTDRVCGKRLPAGEQLVDVKIRGGRGTARFALPEGFEMPYGALVSAKPTKHGWISLVRMTDEEKAQHLQAGGVGVSYPPAATVSDR